LIGNVITESVLNEQVEEYYACDQFKNDEQKYKLCRRISYLQKWLYDNDGLGLQDIIDNALNPIKSPFTEDQKQKFKGGAELLHQMGKISKGALYYFIKDKVEGGKIVLINDKWIPVNKLNTNTADLAELLTDLLYKSPDAKPIISKIMGNTKEGLLTIKSVLPRLLRKYFEDPSTLFDYVKNTTFRSDLGEMAENKVKKELEDKGFKLLYQGGDGDLIDMNYGTDLIMEHPEYGKKTIQVKLNERAWDRSRNYKYIDWVIIAEPFTVYDNKTKEVIEL
jgi:uncharacterized protein YcgL (UPF0745 family)